MRKLFAVMVATLAFTAVASADELNGEMNGTHSNPAGTSLSGTMNTSNPTPSMMSSQMVIDRIHAINQEEIHAGKMAKSNGTKAIHSYAETLVKDHEKADKDLKSLAKKMKLDFTDPDKVSWPADVQQKMQQGQAMMDQLKNMKGADFDKQFLTMMSDGHQDALNYLKQVSSTSQDEQIKNFVAQIQPTIEKHKTMADDLKSHVGETVQGRR